MINIFSVYILGKVIEQLDNLDFLEEGNLIVGGILTLGQVD